MSDPVPPIQVTIDLDKHLAAFHDGYDRDGEAVTEPQTVEGIIIERAASIVAERAIRDADQYPTVKEAAKKKITALVEAKVTAAVLEALNTARTPTDTWGNAKGEPTTLAEQIDKQVSDLLSKNHQGDGFNRKASGTLVQQAIAVAVKDGVAKQVKAAVDAERDAVVARVAAASAAVLTEGLKRAVTP